MSVNYHFTRECNYSCGFCFHTYTNRDILALEEAKRGLALLPPFGLRKINFAGGEPFLKPKFLGELVKFCKNELKLESVSIVSNGSKLTEQWFKTYGTYLDILAISVDSFDEEVNVKIGRGKGDHCKNAKRAKELCEKYGVKFKINSVVCKYNMNEDMNAMIEELKPFRWKVFQVLELKGENDGNATKRDVQPFLISREEFQAFLERHKGQASLVPESNSEMKNSYILLDEQLRFLDSSSGGKIPSKSILEVGVEEAFKESGYDHGIFQERGGIYDWSNQVCGAVPDW